MFRTAIVLVLALACFDASAFRVIEQTERPYELALADATLPASAAGSVSFKLCESCKTVVHPVNGMTRYFLNDRELALEDFLIAVADIKTLEGSNPRSFMGVYVDIQSQRVNRIRVSQLR